MKAHDISVSVSSTYEAYDKLLQEAVARSTGDKEDGEAEVPSREEDVKLASVDPEFKWVVVRVALVVKDTIAFFSVSEAARALKLKFKSCSSFALDTCLCCLLPL
jgi:hypothetical protein